MMIHAFIFGNARRSVGPNASKGRTALHASREIFAATPFDDAMARKGYAINKMCFGERAGARRFRRLRNRQWRRRSRMTKTSQKAIQT